MDCPNCPKLQAEIEEQCRLNGMGSEREAKLQAEVERLEGELADNEPEDEKTMRALIAFNCFPCGSYDDELGVCKRCSAWPTSGETFGRMRRALQEIGAIRRID